MYREQDNLTLRLADIAMWNSAKGRRISGL